MFKALHRLDGIQYAIKKIIVLSSRLKTITLYLKEVKTLAKLNHPNIIQYKVAWIEPSLPSSFVSNVPSTSTSHRSHTSECTKDSKSDNSQSKENSSNDTSNSNFDKARCSIRQDMSVDNKASYASNVSAKLSDKQKNKLHGSAGSHAVKTHIANERFHELNSLINIIGDRITKQSITKESSEESSHTVSFRNSGSSENKDQAAKCSASVDYSDSRQESSNHREVCTFVSSSTSNGINIANVH